MDYQEVKVKLTNVQLNNLKSAAKNKTGKTLRITKKNVQYEELPHELFLTTTQKTKIRNAFSNNMSTNINLSTAQLSKNIQSGGSLSKSLGNMMGDLGKKALLELAVPLPEDVLPRLATKAISFVLAKFERKISVQGLA